MLRSLLSIGQGLGQSHGFLCECWGLGRSRTWRFTALPPCAGQWHGLYRLTCSMLRLMFVGFLLLQLPPPNPDPLLPSSGPPGSWSALNASTGSLFWDFRLSVTNSLVQAERKQEKSSYSSGPFLWACQGLAATLNQRPQHLSDVSGCKVTPLGSHNHFSPSPSDLRRSCSLRTTLAGFPKPYLHPINNPLIQLCHHPARKAHLILAWAVAETTSPALSVEMKHLKVRSHK